MDLTGATCAGEVRGMRKVVIHRAGGYERLRIEEAATPEPGPGELRIDVAAIGVNYADCVIRMGLYASAKQYVGWPITPGFEVAGVVSGLGAGVDGWSLGQRVIAVTRFGGYAEQVCVPGSQVFSPPVGLTVAEGAGLPTIFLTADHALHTLARVRAGEWVLVHAAAGGVGSALVQLAAQRGVRVVGVVGGQGKVAAARGLGAELVIDRTLPGLWDRARAAAPEGFSAIFDANGVSTLRASYRHLAPAGRLVIYGFHSMLPRRGGRPNYLKLAIDYVRTPWFSAMGLVNHNKSVLGFNLSYLFHREDLLREAMGRVLAGFAEGALRMPAVRTYALEEVARAHADLESGTTIGKLVLRV